MRRKIGYFRGKGPDDGERKILKEMGLKFRKKNSRKSNLKAIDDYLFLISKVLNK